MSGVYDAAHMRNAMCVWVMYSTLGILCYRCLRKKRPSRHKAVYRDVDFISQNTGRKAYPYISLYVATVVFFADTGIDEFYKIMRDPHQSQGFS